MADTQLVSKKVPVDKVVVEKATQIRCRVSQEYVVELADLLKADPALEMTPIVLVRDADSNLILADGAHRLAAYIEVGREKIPAMVDEEHKEQALSYAVEYACGQNVKHGLRMTNADKNKAVIMVMEDDRMKVKTDVTLARLLGVSPSLIAKVRKRGRRVFDAPKVKQAPAAAPASKSRAPKPSSAPEVSASEANAAAASAKEDPGVDAVIQIDAWVKAGLVNFDSVAPLFRTETHAPMLLPILPCDGRVKAGESTKKVKITGLVVVNRGIKDVLEVSIEDTKTANA